MRNKLEKEIAVGRTRFFSLRPGWRGVWIFGPAASGKTTIAHFLRWKGPINGFNNPQARPDVVSWGTATSSWLRCYLRIGPRPAIIDDIPHDCRRDAIMVPAPWRPCIFVSDHLPKWVRKTRAFTIIDLTGREDEIGELDLKKLREKADSPTTPWG